MFNIKHLIVNLLEVIEFNKIKLFSNIFGSHYVLNSLKTCRKPNILKVLTKYGAHVGKNNHFKGCLQIDNAGSSINELFSNLIIGNNCYIGKNVFLDLANEIILRDEVVLSSGVSIVTHADVGDRRMCKYFNRKSEKVIISESSWIGVNSTILAGVKINKFAVVGAMSLVNKSLKDYSVSYGVPARKQRDII